MTLRRLQFSVGVAYVLTKYKSQGQALDAVGLDLTASVFGHGQLYVALSRATGFRQLAILLHSTETGANRQTHNIVYREVFRD
jgi:ATP-dependent exoDNAse (exonuclease V) alpha subunit